MERLALIVIDNGRGLTEAQLKDIRDVMKYIPRINRGFVPRDPNWGYRLNLDERAERTMGMGLYISSKLADRSGGILEYVSREGRGSTFIVSFKVAEYDQIIS